MHPEQSKTHLFPVLWKCWLTSWEIVQLVMDIKLHFTVWQIIRKLLSLCNCEKRKGQAQLFASKHRWWARLGFGYWDFFISVLLLRLVLQFMNPYLDMKHCHQYIYYYYLLSETGIGTQKIQSLYPQSTLQKRLKIFNPCQIVYIFLNDLNYFPVFFIQLDAKFTFLVLTGLKTYF